MNPSIQRGLRWAVLVSAGLVVLGVFLQVYLIASYIFGAGEDALDAHVDAGGLVHLFELLAFVLAIGAWWKAWRGIILPFALAAIGTIQIGLSEADDWAGGLHGLFALIVLILAHALAVRTMRDLGIGRHGAHGA